MLLHGPLRIPLLKTARRSLCSLSSLVESQDISVRKISPFLPLRSQPPSLIVQHRILRGHKGQDRHLCWLPSRERVGEVTRKEAHSSAYIGEAFDFAALPSRYVTNLECMRLYSLPVVLHIDGSLDWVQVNAGQVLWRPDDVSDSFYIVINGRLRAISEKEGGGVTILAEYGQGDTVGELDVITSSPRRNTLHAIRDTELIRMPQTLFNAISSRHPATTAQCVCLLYRLMMTIDTVSRLLRMIASRVRTEVDSETRNAPLESSRSNSNLKTVAIMPSSRNVPIEAFGRKLYAALESLGAPTFYLNQSSVSDHLGRHAFTRMGKLKAAGWLAEQEQKYRIVLYVADSAVSSTWTQTCVRQVRTSRFTAPIADRTHRRTM